MTNKELPLPLDKKIRILEIANMPDRQGSVSAWVYTWASPDWLQQLVDEGMLEIIPDHKLEAEYGNRFFGGPCNYYCSPDVAITDKGREFLKSQMIGVGEW
jgi:hypothetical protein